MGQEQGRPEEVQRQQIKLNTSYQLDIRLIEPFNALPTYFSASTQRIIQDLQDLSSKIPAHPLEPYLIHAIDARFSKKNKVSMEAVSAGKSPIEFLSIDESKFQHEHWFQLQTKERFLKTLALFERHYEIQLLIQKEFESANRIQSKTESAMTLRRPMKSSMTAKMNQQLIVRMLFHYYAVIIKTYANTGEKHIFRFHEQTGAQLCLMIFHGYLSLEELYELFYFMVFIDKHPSSVTGMLSTINKIYHSKSLKSYYTIHVDKRRQQSLQSTARLYLDELYMNSVKEAEDPEIRNTDDTLMPIKVFPISRVKDKPKVL